MLLSLTTLTRGTRARLKCSLFAGLAASRLGVEQVQLQLSGLTAVLAVTIRVAPLTFSTARKMHNYV